jgi:predicted nuclease with TOPRIM domain
LGAPVQIQKVVIQDEEIVEKSKRLEGEVNDLRKQLQDLSLKKSAASDDGAKVRDLEQKLAKIGMETEQRIALMAEEYEKKLS